MNERDFIYWLNGFVELADPDTLNKTQMQILKDHLKLVMHKVTPTYDIKDSAPITESKQYECAGCQMLGRKCIMCAVSDSAKQIKSCDTTEASTNPNSNNTTTDSGLIVNQYYKRNWLFFAYPEHPGDGKNGTQIDGTFLLLEQRPVWYGERCYILKIEYNNKQLYTEITERQISDFKMVPEPMISPWQDKVIEPYHYRRPNAVGLEALYGTSSEHIIKLIREQDYLNQDHITSPESLKTDQYCILDLRGWARDAAGQLIGPIITGSITLNNSNIDPKIGTKTYDYGDGKIIAKTNEDHSLSWFKVNEGSTYEQAKSDITKHATPIDTSKNDGSAEYQQIAHRLFGVNNCPLMHPTCSRNHYSRDPNNTPEEREKLLIWENSRMFHTSSQSQIKCEYEEKYGYRCVNHKHLDKIGSEESGKNMFDNATKITPDSEQYYRNIKCTMSC